MIKYYGNNIGKYDRKRCEPARGTIILLSETLLFRALFIQLILYNLKYTFNREYLRSTIASMNLQSSF